MKISNGRSLTDRKHRKALSSTDNDLSALSGALACNSTIRGFTTFGKITFLKSRRRMPFSDATSMSATITLSTISILMRLTASTFSPFEESFRTARRFCTKRFRTSLKSRTSRHSSETFDKCTMQRGTRTRVLPRTTHSIWTSTTQMMHGVFLFAPLTGSDADLAPKQRCSRCR